MTIRDVLTKLDDLQHMQMTIQGNAKDSAFMKALQDRSFFLPKKKDVHIIEVNEEKIPANNVNLLSAPLLQKINDH